MASSVAVYRKHGGRGGLNCDGSGRGGLSLVENLDLIPSGLEWGPGPNNLRFESGFKGAVQILGVDLNARTVTPITHGERAVHGFDVNEKAGVMTYLANDFDTPNARDIRDRSFCLYLNENYGASEASDCAAAILKVERYFNRS